MTRKIEAVPTRLILMRHAESEANAGKLMAGSWDVPLTAKGKREAEDAREKLEPLGPIKRYISSDLLRARQTIYLATGNHPEIVPHLREMHLGEAEGKAVTREHIHFLSKIPYTERGEMAIAKGAETDPEIWQRWEGLFDERGEEFEGETILGGSHAAFMASIASRISGENVTLVKNGALLVVDAHGNPRKPEFTVVKDLSEGVIFQAAA